MAATSLQSTRNRLNATFGLVVLLSVVLLCQQFGCRFPARRLPATNQGVFYDTAYVPPKEPHPPLLQYLDELHVRYQKTLAEPVAIEHWGDGYSDWQIPVVTNRGSDDSEPSETTWQPNNAATKDLRWGLARTRIPGRSRGEDPQTASDRKSGLSRLWRKSTSQTEHTAEILALQSQSQTQFFQTLNDQILASPGRDLLVFVHGFNVSFEAAVVRTAQLGLDLPFNGGVCCYSWPSQGGVKNYRLDEQVNAATVEPFKEFLLQITSQVPAETRVHVVVHSMGNRFVLRALSEFGKQPGATQLIDHLVLCAPDVGLQDFADWIPAAGQVSRKITMYVGDSDTALLASKALHSEQRIGDAIPPVVVPGVETIDCSAIEFSLMGHSYYGGNIEVLCDLFSVVKEHLPPDQRPWLSPQEHNGQTYWTFASRPTPVHVTWNFPESKRVR